MSAGDPGLFGPNSQTWRVHADVSMALGGLRALMLQTLHPLAMAGVAQHSDFREDPWGRLLRTAEYIGTVTYGTTVEAQRAGARVRGVHRRLAGVEPESGRPYRVDDPELLLWVHCAEVDSFLSAFRACGGRLAPAEADAYVAEQVRAAELVGIPAAVVPDGTAALAAYFRRVRPQLHATTETRAAMRFLLSPPMGAVEDRPLHRRVAAGPIGLAARPAWLILASVAFGLLPRWARLRFGVSGALTAHPGTDLAAALAGRGLRSALHLVPSGLRESPARKAAYARLADATRGPGESGLSPGPVAASLGRP